MLSPIISRYSGIPPKEILAFAVMVDTDDTEEPGAAWFDDLTFSSSSRILENSALPPLVS